MKLITELHLVVRLRMSGGIPPVLPSFLYESIDTTLPLTWPQGKLEVVHLVGNTEKFLKAVPVVCDCNTFDIW